MNSSRCALALTLSLSLSLACACSDPPSAPPVDAGVDATLTPECDAVRSCDDDVRCNGVETCISGRCQPGRPPCREGQLCDESTAACFTECAVSEDADGDAVRASECGGTDCDDSDADRFPGNDEVCDVANHDEDCDPSTYGFRDNDEDGSPDARCCNIDPVDDVPRCGRDCDDSAPGVNPMVPEVCNGFDDDCDGQTDEGLIVILTADSDGDGHGGIGAAQMPACRGMVGYAELADDCDDDNAERFPGNPEVCDVAMVDEDCSGFGNDIVCDCVGTATELCGTLGPCAGAQRECNDSGTWGPCAVVPQTEVCNGVDDDCDGSVDETLTVTCYRDNDGDSYAGDAASATPTCRSAATDRVGAPWNGCPVGFTSRAPTAGTDCCDRDVRAFPGATTFRDTARTCGGFDFNCDGTLTAERADTRNSCSQANGCVATGTTDGWCSSGPPANCGNSAGWGSGCWNGGAGCFPTTCWPTPKRCR